MTRTFTLALALAGALATGSTAAMASQADQTSEVRVGDLDLSSASGQAALDRRISAAAKKICGDGRRTGSNIPDSSWLRSCTAQVRNQVTARLDQRG
ncbi:UrcA family protein [Novosphingobium sp.]|uniref:UrcA family protein n=1 Tax=Novosphingobium sp. TaxID=1874826 RepID=UPI001EC7CF61|nr:UrcA family protein [Novosphingobium sp.]MBK6802921.1 UrcA family protein [Novosphingobium sp.]MBK9012230.1 UrcA family protein [Novosphingobium sp.]